MCRYRFSPQFTQNVLAKLDPRDRKLTLDNFIVVSVQVRARFKNLCLVFFSTNACFVVFTVNFETTLFSS